MADTGCGDLSSSRKVATATGICVPPMPVISTRNCASAGALAAAARAPMKRRRGQHGAKERRSASLGSLSGSKVCKQGPGHAKTWSTIDAPEFRGGSWPNGRRRTIVGNPRPGRSRLAPPWQRAVIIAAPGNHAPRAPSPMPSLLQRIARFAPYFKSGRHGITVAFAASMVMALTEPVLPALMKPLLDNGFGQTDIPLWLVPVVLIGVFVLRGAATFIAQYTLAWTANQGVLNLRSAMFGRLLGAHPELFTRHTASKLTNILVYEVQQGSDLLVSAVLAVVRESLTLLALLGYLIWLNWKLTLFVGVMFPLVACRCGSSAGACGASRWPARRPPTSWPT